MEEKKYTTAMVFNTNVRLYFVRTVKNLKEEP